MISDGVVNILVSRKKVEWVAHNFEISNHAKMQMVRRGLLNTNIASLILNSPLFWKEGKAYIAIAFNLFEYIIVAVPEMNSGKPVIVTYVSLKDQGYSVIDKMLIAYQEQTRIVESGGKK